MINKNLYLRIFVMILTFGLLSAWSLEAQTDSRLNGRWYAVVEGVESEFSMNNGSYELSSNGNLDSRGTYSTNNGEITTKPTHVFGGSVNDAVGFPVLESKWYTVNEFASAIRVVFLEFGLPEEVINEIIQMMISPSPASYSVDANTFTLTSTIEGERIVRVYTKR